MCSPEVIGDLKSTIHNLIGGWITRSYGGWRAGPNRFGALHPTPYTLHPTQYTPQPTLYALHPTPNTLHPTPYTLCPTPYTLHSTPYTLHPEAVRRGAEQMEHPPGVELVHYALNPEPLTLNPEPSTLNPEP